MFSKVLKADPATRATYRSILARSSAYAIAAGFISLLVEMILTIMGALIKGYAIVLNYDTMKIIASSDTWDQDAVLLIYLMPLMVMAIIFIFLNYRMMKHENPNFINIFLLWLMLFMVYRLLGVFPAHMIFNKGIHYAIDWLYIGTSLQFIAGFLSLLIFMLTGYKISRAIIILCGSYYNHIRDMGMVNLIMSSYFIPVTLVIAVSLVYYLPSWPLDEITGLAILFVLCIYSFNKLIKIDASIFAFKQHVNSNNNPSWLITYLLSSITVLRILLGLGISL